MCKYRCGRKGCRSIFHLSKPPEQFKITKKCHCGGNLHDYSSDRRRNKFRTCNCDGLHYPHRKGSSVWCVHHSVGPSNEDYCKRYPNY